MIIREVFQNITKILIPKIPLLVEQTSAAELLNISSPDAEVSTESPTALEKGAFILTTAENSTFSINKIITEAPKDKHWVFICISADCTGELIVSHATLLYAYTMKLVEEWPKMPVDSFEAGKYFTAAFRWHRPLYDYLLTQVWRTARNFDPEAHIREMARAGYTHIEVNGMAAPSPCEESVPGEFYSPFYSYCLALDQYVYSELNQGIYPFDYLAANLNLLKKYARLGRKYGLKPGILCFEPRSVPDKLLQKYPTLRGARVDHPFRSRKPRYSLSHAHPTVQEHYKEMMQKLLHEVPGLAYMSIWSNDSGAGFEYTSSLYVGRNGGPYLIREWRTHEQIAKAAGRNVVQFMSILRNAAAEINSDFHVSLRLEPFKVEHDVIINNLKNNMDIEVPSMLVHGYELPYTHDKYPDINGVAGTVQHIHLDLQENEHIERLQKNGVNAHFMYSHGNGFNFEPLCGIPFPWLLYQKLRAMSENGVKYAANLGGFTPSRYAPYHINQEIFRAFMLDCETNIDEIIKQKATYWVGLNAADSLIKIWKNAEDAIRWIPPLPLYSGFGFVWLRLWVRPIIADLFAIPGQNRRYYEDFMVSSKNNTNLSDIGRDVLFELITQDYGEKYVQRVDANVWQPLDDAISLSTNQASNHALSEKSRLVFVDQRDRLRALRCWLGTLRSVAAWCAGVYAYLNSSDANTKKKWRDYLDDMIGKEIQNTRDLLALWQSSDVDFMFVSGTGETSFIYGDNFGELLKRKIELMEKYQDVEPRIDKEIMWRI